MRTPLFLVDLCQILQHLSDNDTVKWSLMMEKYQAHMASISSLLYERLPTAERHRFVQWFLKRWAQINIINEVEYGLYSNRIKMVRSEDCEEVVLQGRPYKLRNFMSQGYDFKLLAYDWVLGVHDVYYNQYEQGDCVLRPGDVIIDAGAFVGDTAVLFNHKLKGDCEVHCFELLDENLVLMQYNLQANGMENARLQINKFALSDQTGQLIQVKKGTTQGSTSMFGGQAGIDQVETITLDDYVQIMNLNRVDFIKMDIEGAEMPALRGAISTIRHFRPRLALCVYHRWDDVITIPRFLEETGVPYVYRFKWVQLTHGWEAVLLAHPADEHQALQSSPVMQEVEAGHILTKALTQINASLLGRLRASRQQVAQTASKA